jgi:hypothetical protein
VRLAVIFYFFTYPVNLTIMRLEGAASERCRVFRPASPTA